MSAAATATMTGPMTQEGWVYGLSTGLPATPAQGPGRFRASSGSYQVTYPDRGRRTLAALGGTADKHLDELTLWRLREICRAFDRNSPLLHGIVERWLDNVIGPSFSFQPQTGDEGLNKSISQYVTAHMGKVADSRGLMSFRRLARTWLRATAIDGDVLPVFTEGGMATYEADQLGTPRKGADTRGAKIINGVEVDESSGRPKAFWVTARKYGGWFDKMSQATRVPAEETIFPANLERVSQTRGVPVLASSLNLFDRTDDYIDNEMLSAELGARLSLFITRNNEFWSQSSLPADTRQGETMKASGTYETLLEFRPGSVSDMGPNEDVKMFNNNRPGVTFEPAVYMCLRMIGCGLGMPLELVLLDFSRTNYSSARASLLQAYRTFRCWQEFSKEEILTPWYQRTVGQGIVDRELMLRADAFRVKWLMPRWAWIDPWREIQAAEKAVSMGIDTLTDTIELEQETLADLVARRKAELEAFKKANIPTSTAPKNLGGDEANTAPLKDEDAMPEKEPVEAD